MPNFCPEQCASAYLSLLAWGLNPRRRGQSYSINFFNLLQSGSVWRGLWSTPGEKDCPEVAYRVNIRLFFLCLLIAILSGCADSAAQSDPLQFTPRAVAPPTQAIPDEPREQPPPTGEQEAVSGRAFEDNLPLAARVNNQPIFLDTYQKQVAQMVQALEAQGLDLATESGQETLGQVQRQVLQALIDQRIIEQQAGKLGLTVTEAMLEARIQESIAQGQGQDQFEAWLAANNLTYEEFKDTLRAQLIANQVFEQITGHVPETAEQIQLRHIQVADEATARAIVEQLKNGADFATLARAQSLDESSRANGGDLGWFPRRLGPIPPAVEAMAFSLQPGQVSGPIQSPLGFHVIKLEHKEAERPLTNEMLQALKKQIFTDWLREQQSSTTVERFIGL